jgi:hypothetical protein
VKTALVGAVSPKMRHRTKRSFSNQVVDHLKHRAARALAAHPACRSSVRRFVYKSPAYVARVRAPGGPYLSVPIAEDVELSVKL